MIKLGEDVRLSRSKDCTNGLVRLSPGFPQPLLCESASPSSASGGELGMVLAGLPLAAPTRVPDAPEAARLSGRSPLCFVAPASPVAIVEPSYTTSKGRQEVKTS